MSDGYLDSQPSKISSLENDRKPSIFWDQREVKISKFTFINIFRTVSGLFETVSTVNMIKNVNRINGGVRRNRSRHCFPHCDTEWPNIGLFCVSMVANAFGRHPLQRQFRMLRWSSNYFKPTIFHVHLPVIIRLVQIPAEPKIANFYNIPFDFVIKRSDEDVSGGKITMNFSLDSQVLHSSADVDAIADQFGYCYFIVRIAL